MIEPGDLQEFRALLGRRLGLHFGDDKLELLRDTLRQALLEGRHASPAAYFQALSGLGGPDLERLVEALTVTETYFFRHWDHYQALVDVAIPARLQARAQERRLRILSAGCASGEEAYSLAIVLRDRFPQLEGWELSITGADLNAAMLRKAKAGLYSTWSMRDSPPDLQQRYFQAEGKDFRIRPDIRAMVEFQSRNLSEPNLDLWPAGAYDVVFCRNMIMYLQPGAAAALVGRIAAALAPGGFLFLGYAETLRGLSQDFHLCHTHETFYYQRLDGRPAPAVATPAPWEVAAPELGVSWVEAIQRASERIAGLAERAAVPAAAGRRTAPEPRRLERALELLRREDYSEALRALPEEDDADADALLLRAVLLVDLARLPEAEDACRRLLAGDELNAGAHYVMALCREHAGELAAAQEQDNTALYLDPDFSMPWLHLGLLARRRAQPAQARRCLEQALALLAREDSSRLLLFSGGFGREGLMQFCRNSLLSLETAP